MSNSPRRNRRFSRSDALAALSSILIAVTAAACWSSNASLPGKTDDAASAVARTEAAGVRSTDDGRFVLVAPDEALQTPGWVRIVPILWPVDGPERPLLGVGHIEPAGDEVELDLIALREVGALADLRVEPIDAPVALDDSKLLAAIELVEDGSVEIGCGEADGVSPGDIYFSLSRDADPVGARLGDRIGALLRVTEVGDKSSRARIEHVTEAPEVGDLALFAQAHLDIPIETATILVAPLTSDAGDDGNIPPIVDAVPGYLAEFGLSNIGVATLETYLDPYGPNAPRDASTSVDDRDGYGALVFGDLTDDALVLNTTIWGNTPHPGSTVGILPGGLPLPLDQGVEGLSEQLVPGVLANVLALRGDHAIAIYLLETVLRRAALVPEVRYHLREHLALRYDAIGRFDEALELMRVDVAQAAADGHDLALLNALSIRASLANENNLIDQWVADTSQFLDVAALVLPEESLGSERLQHARALSAADRAEDARVVVQSVVDDAEVWEDDDLRISGMIELALALSREDEAGAALVLDGLLEQPGGAERTTILLVDLLSAELALAMGDGERAMDRVDRALSALDQDDALPLRAAVFRRASGVYLMAERTAESVTSLEMATTLYLESAQLDQATGVLVQLAMTELRHAGVAPPREALAALQQARSNLYLGAELAVHLGYDASAARAFMYAAILEYQFEQIATASALFDRAQELAEQCAHYALLYEIHAERAQLSARMGDYGSAQLHQDSARYWAEAGGIEPELDPINAPAF